MYLEFWMLHDGNQHTVASKNLAFINVGQFLGQRTLLNGKKMGTLGQAILGNLEMKSMVICYSFHMGISKGCNLFYGI